MNLASEFPLCLWFCSSSARCLQSRGRLPIFPSTTLHPQGEKTALSVCFPAPVWMSGAFKCLPTIFNEFWHFLVLPLFPKGESFVYGRWFARQFLMCSLIYSLQPFWGIGVRIYVLQRSKQKLTMEIIESYDLFWLLCHDDPRWGQMGCLPSQHHVHCALAVYHQDKVRSQSVPPPHTYSLDMKA